MVTPWHRLGSVLATLWFATLCAYCLPWDELGAKRPEPVTNVVQVTQLYQSWRMFRNPTKWNRFLIHEGRYADGIWRPIVQDTRPPEGDFLVLDYGRWRKVQFAMSKDSKYLEPYANWVCTQGEVQAVRLTHLRTRKLNVRTARTGEPRPQKTEVIWEQECQ